MVNQKLVDYVKNCLSEDKEIIDIKSVVLKNGWKDKDFTEALIQIATEIKSQLKQKS